MKQLHKHECQVSIKSKNCWKPKYYLKTNSIPTYCIIILGNNILHLNTIFSPESSKSEIYNDITWIAKIISIFKQDFWIVPDSHLLQQSCPCTLTCRTWIQNVLWNFVIKCVNININIYFYKKLIFFLNSIEEISKMKVNNVDALYYKWNIHCYLVNKIIFVFCRVVKVNCQLMLQCCTFNEPIKIFLTVPTHKQTQMQSETLKNIISKRGDICVLKYVALL